MNRFIRPIMLSVLCSLLLVPLTALAAYASTTPLARVSTQAAGPYIVDIGITQDPPHVDEAFNVVVTPHDHTLHLSGKVIAEPGSGTDATNIPTTLTPLNNTESLESAVQIPVRGAWTIVVQLTGPKGSGTTSITVTAGAPGAMAPWLAWTIGALPLLFVLFWIWYQHRYRRTLINKVEAA